MREIQLTKGKVAIVDDADYEWLIQRKWCATKTADLFYATSGNDAKRIMMHQLILGVKGVDHRDGNGLNNQRYNLRPASLTQNNGNMKRHRDNTSGFKGVSRDRGKWRASIKRNGITTNLGRCEDPKDAARMYDEAAIDYFGEFARTNAMMGLL